MKNNLKRITAANRSSVRSIQLRLFVLLLRAFTAVVLLTVLFILALTGILISQHNMATSLFGTFFTAPLETYYLAHGSWDGVGILFSNGAITAAQTDVDTWKNELVLDASGRILIDQGQSNTPLIGTVYQKQGGDIFIPLTVNGNPVGSVVMVGGRHFNAFQSVGGLLLTVVVLSILPALLTLIIGLLLVRRFITPLADVIAAAQSMARGNFSTRVEVRGPDDLRALSDSFNQMAEARERYDRERRNMLADIAHELRTPLTVIRGRLEGILDGIYSPDGDHIAPVLEETYLLERLVEDLRLLTLAESRQLAFEQRPTDLGELAERVATLFEAEAAEKDIALVVVVQRDLPQVTIDPQRTEQVIGNLLSNALRFTPPSGRIDLRVVSIPDGVSLQVSDTGSGVPSESLPYIFDRFWRGEKSRSRAAGGAGLGLAIARQLVEAQGGEIHASNLPGGGLQVNFSFRASSDLNHP